MKKHLLETLRWILVLPLSGVVLLGAYQLVLMTHWVFFFINNAFFNWIVELFAGSIGSVAFIYTGTLIAPRFRKIVCFILLILYLIYCVNTIVKIHVTYEGWEFMEWLSYSLTNIVAAIAGYMICKDQINNVL